MAATTVASPASPRPPTLTAAVALLAVAGFLAPILLVSIEQIPPPALLAGVGLAIVKLAAAAGLWRNKKWAAILGGLAVTLDALSAAPGLVDAPNVPTVLYIVAVIALSVATLALLACPPSRRAYA